MNANHQHTSLIRQEACYRAVGRFKLFQFILCRTMDDRTSLTRFPKMAHFIDKNIAEIIIISRGIALQLMGFLCGYIKTEKAITRCSYQ